MFDPTMMIYTNFTIFTFGSVAWFIGRVLIGAATAQRAARDAVDQPTI